MNIIRIPGEAPGVVYEVDFDEAPLGAGGMGSVLKGIRIDSMGVRTPVAVKFLFEDLPDDAVERARREASVRIDSENLVKMYAFLDITQPGPDGKTIHRYHVVSELLYGVMLFDVLADNYESVPDMSETTARLLKQRVDNPEEFALSIVKAVLSGVTVLHDKGYVHRDIDPSNIMLTWDGRVKLIDFGISKKIENTENDRKLTVSGQFMGKAAYAAPELASGDTMYQNQTTDIYAIGIMLYELLTGKVPFSGPTHEVIKRQLEERIPYENIADKRLRQIVEKATAKTQKDRYQSASAFRVAIEEAQTSMKKKPAKSSYGKVLVDTPEKPKKKLSGALIGGITGAVVAIAGFTAIILNMGGDKEPMPPQPDPTPVEAEAKVSPYDGRSGHDHIASITDDASRQREEQYVKAITDRNSVATAAQKGDAALWWGLFLVKDERVPAAAQAVSPGDEAAAHQWFGRATEFDPENFDALYEICVDLLNGRGTVKEKDYTTLLQTIETALKVAAKHTDNADIQARAEKLKIVAGALQ